MLIITMRSSIVIILFSAVSVLSYAVEHDSGQTLKWPKKYYVEAFKMTLTGGLIEDIKEWHTKSKSRLDYNNGAVKSIAIAGKKIKNYGYKYKINPVTTEDDTNEIICKKVPGSILKKVSTETILPASLEDYELLGEDILGEKNYTKYFYQEVDDAKDKRRTLTVYFDESNKNWIPIRFEEVEYNNWMKSIESHVIWEFHNFKTDFNDDVFSIENYDCETESNKEIEDFDSNLLFIDPENVDHIDYYFESFKQKHDKVYVDDKEHALRRHIFHHNLRLIKTRNQQNITYKLTMNKFADRTPDELKRYRGLIRKDKNDVGTIAFPYSKADVREIAQRLPKYFDLRLDGLVTPVEDQDGCGSCWSFGTTSAVEGALARKNGDRLVRLSKQALVDCAWGFGPQGCDGGSDTGAYKWIMEYGMPTLEEYGPYVSQDGFCNIDNMTETYKIEGFTDVTPFSVDALKVALVNHGPLTVSMHVTNEFPLYSGGIYYNSKCDPLKLNHEVSLVGYGEKDGEPYWIVKNSWGINWGIDGYFHIMVNNNDCGIATEPTYPVF